MERSARLRDTVGLSREQLTRGESSSLEQVAAVLSLAHNIMVAIPFKRSELLTSQTRTLPSSFPGNHE